MSPRDGSKRPGREARQTSPARRRPEPAGAAPIGPEPADGSEIVRDIVAHHFEPGPGPLDVQPLASGAYRVMSRDMAWTVESLPPREGSPFSLYEVASDITPVDSRGPLPAVARLPDGRSFLISETEGLSLFLAAAVEGGASPGPLADIVCHFRGRGMEQPIGVDDLAEAGLKALRSAGIEPGPPVLERLAGGSWELRFVGASVSPSTVDGSIAVDFREWTARGLPDGTVDWQARPLALGVPRAVKGLATR